ncbi:MAG: hypothetical protein M1835_006454 [Candelina submexicana]|nr:MAG: hypothetical protein M1835_006454 [Candelina submexicana]
MSRTLVEAIPVETPRLIPAVNGSMEEIDLYKVLGVSKTASKAEVKKAYHKAALTSHPDKVAHEDRSDAEIKFKAISQAYEILYDDDKRHLYDQHGMSAFEKGAGGMGGEVDLDDILQQMFGMGVGGVPSGFGGGRGAGPRKPRKGKDQEQRYEVTLEELYKGKTTKFASTKNVICSLCKGSGGKDKAKPKQCASCGGNGPGLVTQEQVVCSACKGAGNAFKDKDRCKKCKGNRTNEERKVLELYIPRGAKEGERIVLEGEADQVPDQEPGDIVFTLVETEHHNFNRSGSDLKADMHITLAEALCGFNRVVIKHLDGRGIRINHPQPRGRILRPDEVLKVAGEGMPLKKSDTKGDLYLIVKIKFPSDGWLKDDIMIQKLQELLPKPEEPIHAETVDEVEYEENVDIDSQWVDADEGDNEDGEDEGQPQCAQQ